MGILKGTFQGLGFLSPNRKIMANWLRGYLKPGQSKPNSLGACIKGACTHSKPNPHSRMASFVLT